MDHHGKITLKKLGLPEETVEYHHEQKNFGSDCVYFAQKHIVKSLQGKIKPETLGRDYLKNIEIQEAIYESSESNTVIKVKA